MRWNYLAEGRLGGTASFNDDISNYKMKTDASLAVDSVDPKHISLSSFLNYMDAFGLDTNLNNL